MHLTRVCCLARSDYDDRTPLHLAACNGKTAALEFLLKQPTVLINAVDRFGGTPYQDALRHGRKGAAALLEEAGCIRSDDKSCKETIKQMIEKSNWKKEERQKREREPKIRHVLDNSQESKMVATISDKLSKEIAGQSKQIEVISQRLIWGLRGFGDRLVNNSCNIPFTDKTFVRSSSHVLEIISEMMLSVNNSRVSLIAEMQGDEGAADCLIWRNASKEYKKQANDLDDQMRQLIVLAKVAKRILKAVIKVCTRGERQSMYADNDVRLLLESAHLDSEKLAREAAEKEEAAQNNAVKTAQKATRTKSHRRWSTGTWPTGLRMTLALGRRPSGANPGPPQ